MPHRRRMKKGSFDGHFDWLVPQFPAHSAEATQPRHRRSAGLQEKLDMHALLFEQAWPIEEGE